MEGFDAFARNHNYDRKHDPRRDDSPAKAGMLIVVIEKGAWCKAVPEKSPAEQKPTGPLPSLDKKKSAVALRVETAAALFAGFAGGLLAAAALAALGVAFGD